MVILALEAQKEPWKAACIRPDALRICSPRDSASLKMRPDSQRLLMNVRTFCSHI